MKSIAILFAAFIFLPFILCAQTSEYTTSVTFPADYKVGDYIEFLRVAPSEAGASGYYEVSIAYTRSNVAAAATHLVSISHANPTLWREAGRINSNIYAYGGYNFTVDCNTESGNPRLRVRAVNTFGEATPIVVYIKVRSINRNINYQELNSTGNDLAVNKFLPMTNEWNLYTGNPFSGEGANLAIKATESGNVGIGMANPQEKLSVNGTMRAREVKVEAANWPDYVFRKEYILPPLEQVKQHIEEYGHLPNIPTAKEVQENGVSLGEMNKKLLEKIEELTLYIIELKDQNNQQIIMNVKQQNEIEILKEKLLTK